MFAFSLLAVVISCVGLYAMASFTVLHRTREIGIRKVLGARVIDVMRLLVFQFTRPVMLANLLAWPIAWYFLNDWLLGFAYRIDLSLLFFIFAALLSTCIAWLTVGGHAWHAARSRPINTLRYE